MYEGHHMARVSVPVFPTEERRLVETALFNIFPLEKTGEKENLNTCVSAARIVVEGEGGEKIPVEEISIYSPMDTMKELLAKQRIRDTARGHLLSLCSTSSGEEKYMREETREGRRETAGITFFLSKQAAYMGKVNFSDGRHPLGDIRVEIKGDREQILGFVEWLTFIPQGEMGENHEKNMKNGGGDG